MIFYYEFMVHVYNQMYVNHAYEVSVYLDYASVSCHSVTFPLAFSCFFFDIIVYYDIVLQSNGLYVLLNVNELYI